MEEITQAAKAAYENFSEEEKTEVNELFISMDKNGDGKISLQEFMSFCRDELPAGCNNPMVKRSIFNLLVDQNGDGKLQFEQIMTLLYIVASGRPTCDGCGVFISGLFFTCTNCRLMNKAGVMGYYDLCIPCYHGREFVHQHTEFVDNYVLLLKMQEMLLSGQQYKTQSISSGSMEAEAAKLPTTNSSRSFRASGSKSKRERMKKAFGIFAAVLSVAVNAQTLSL